MILVIMYIENLVSDTIQFIDTDRWNQRQNIQIILNGIYHHFNKISVVSSLSFLLMVETGLSSEKPVTLSFTKQWKTSDPIIYKTVKN